MRERCVPGSLSPPPREPGHEAIPLGFLFYYEQDCDKCGVDNAILYCSDLTSSFVVNVVIEFTVTQNVLAIIHLLQ